MSTDIILDYTPRVAFRAYHENKKRFAVTVAHRRAGKTVARLNRLIREAVTCEKQNPRFGYLAPFYVQAKEIAWNYLKHYTAPLEPLGLTKNESDLSITFGHNNATIRLYGAENAERMRGLYFDGIAPDEAQGINATTLRTIILPCLADRQGWLDISGTPKGWENLLGEVVQIARENPDEWFLQILKASDTGILPESELALQKRLMAENEYAQEYECSFDAAITGAVYAKWLEDADSQGRVVDGLYDPALPIYTSWDLGWGDATAIWFYQCALGEVRLIDYWEDTGRDVRECVEALTGREIVIRSLNNATSAVEKWDYGQPNEHVHRAAYRYAHHNLPHDGAYKLQTAKGRSFAQQLYEFGHKAFVIGATNQETAIQATRKLFPQFWFDRTRCKEGMKAVRNYQFEYDDKIKSFRKTPKHDWASHGSKALEIISRTDVNQNTLTKPADKPKFLHDMTANDLFFPPKPSITWRERI